MYLFEKIKKIIFDSLSSVNSIDINNSSINLENISLELPKNISHGDLSTNIAMLVGKKLNTNPRDLANQIKVDLQNFEMFKKIDIAGPGFINFFLTDKSWQDELINIVKSKNEWGKSNIGNAQAVNIEYVSANPTGPIHVGHVRGAVLGDAIANILKFVGYNVTKEYYVNDSGTQIDILSESLYYRYNELLDINNIKFSEHLYPGEYLIDIASKIVETDKDKWIGSDEDEWKNHFRSFSVNEIMNQIKKDLNLLNINHDIFYYESQLHEKSRISFVIEKLRKLNLIYKGFIPPPKNEKYQNKTPKEQLLFRSTNFGDDVDRALKKNDNTYTYFAADMAYHNDKIERGFDRIINVWGADHSGYIKRVKSAVSSLSKNKINFDIKICNLVKLYKDGKPFKMSKRSGNFVTLNELVNEVGPDVIRFMMLTQKPETPLDFDISKAVEMSSENPVFYVQYAHARIYSLLRKIDDGEFGFKSHTDLSDISPNLTHSGEISLIKKISFWPSVILSAAERNEPHRIVYYLQELANLFHSHWNEGSRNIELRFINIDDETTTKSRILLCLGVLNVLSNGLKIIGVRPVEEMR